MDLSWSSANLEDSGGLSNWLLEFRYLLLPPTFLLGLWQSVCRDPFVLFCFCFCCSMPDGGTQLGPTTTNGGLTNGMPEHAHNFSPEFVDTLFSGTVASNNMPLFSSSSSPALTPLNINLADLAASNFTVNPTPVTMQTTTVTPSQMQAFHQHYSYLPLNTPVSHTPASSPALSQTVPSMNTQSVSFASSSSGFNGSPMSSPLPQMLDIKPKLEYSSPSPSPVSFCHPNAAGSPSGNRPTIIHQQKVTLQHQALLDSISELYNQQNQQLAAIRHKQKILMVMPANFSVFSLFD